MGVRSRAIRDTPNLEWQRYSLLSPRKTSTRDARISPEAAHALT